MSILSDARDRVDYTNTVKRAASRKKGGISKRTIGQRSVFRQMNSMMVLIETWVNFLGFLT